ncbi:hypothetical protein JZ751_000932 [Albula glossodonta]|uniref:C-type lectin domain-containing protein n=1 Tax=Albula glossodonta TaxID=121402 RepID=A0A8T2PXT6_9TELE|nr:hypothetical protein JZ751_000932 [Albula glossodonta]
MASFTMTSFLCVTVLSGITLVSGYSRARFCQGTCPSGWISNNGRCFKYVSYKTNWASAEKRCENMGGNLPSVHSAAEDQFLKNLFKSFSSKDTSFWLGLSDCQKEGWWFWSDGSKLDYTNWRYRQPDNHQGKEHCVHMHTSAGKSWNDIPCSSSFPFICERADPGLA